MLKEDTEEKGFLLLFEFASDELLGRQSTKLFAELGNVA